jgi:hypothetical protein
VLTAEDVEEIIDQSKIKNLQMVKEVSQIKESDSPVPYQMKARQGDDAPVKSP